MGRTNPKELGIKTELIRRYGPDVPVKGMRRRGRDAGSIRFPDFLFLRNARFEDGISGRPAQDRFLADGTLAQSICTSLFDFQCNRARNKLFVIYAGCPGISGTVGQSLNWVDFEQANILSRGIYYQTAVFEACLGVYDDHLYLGRDTLLSQFVSVVPDYDDEALFVAGFDQSEPIKDFTGYTVRCMASHAGELFIGLEDNAAPASSKVVRWDGLTFRDDLTGISPPACMSVFRHENLALTVNNAAGGLRIRDAAGTWSVVAGALGSVQMQHQEYRDNLYISEAGPDLWKYDGAALAIDHTIATATIGGLAEAFGDLYFGHDLAAATRKATIGRLTSAGVYTNVYKDFTVQANPTPPPTDFSFAQHVKRLALYRGALVAGIESVASGGRIFLSRASDVAGTWDMITPDTSNGYGGIVAWGVF